MYPALIALVGLTEEQDEHSNGEGERRQHDEDGKVEHGHPEDAVIGQVDERLPRREAVARKLRTLVIDPYSVVSTRMCVDRRRALQISPRRIRSRMVAILCSITCMLCTVLSTFAVGSLALKRWWRYASEYSLHVEHVQPSSGGPKFRACIVFDRYTFRFLR